MMLADREFRIVPAQELDFIEIARVTTVIGIEAQVHVLDAKGLVSEEWQALENRAKQRGYSVAKQVLVDAVDKAITERQIGPGPYPKPDIYLSIAMPCGQHLKYRTPDDIPDHDVPCPCGDPTHWMIRYRDLREREEDGESTH